MAIRGSSRLVIIFSCSLLLSLPNLTLSEEDVYFKCRYAGENKGNFTANSTYQANLNGIVSQLSSVTEFNSGFHYLSAGEGLDKVFAVGLCMEDRTSTDQCSSCLKYTANKLMERCPWGKEVVAWSQYCMVRYANRNVFGQLDKDPRTCVFNRENVSFVYDLTELMGRHIQENLIEKAATSPLLKYAAGGIQLMKDSGTYQAYSMVQCTPDLTEQNCNTCLNFAMSDELQECCVGRMGCRILRPSCILRIDQQGPFYNSPPSPAMPSPSPMKIEGPYGYEYSEESNTWLKAVIGAAAGLTVIVVLSIAVIFGIRREYLSTKVIGFWKKGTSDDDQNVRAFLRNYGSLAPKQFSYSDVKKMTNSFQHKVGEGGYGTVYRGKRVDGSLVAVKVLRESKSNGEEFINEVASIGRTSHVNIVSFVGFCYERRKRALIYEYMPNGSLDEFIHDQGTSTRRHDHDQLECTTLYKIALGIAKGLEYLHQGCSTRIVHFDIKPQNILLDEDFCPKIADFGLAKLCERKDSIVSMMVARGTIGYIAPEVFCRNYGGVSHKSDVYSYGMVVLEMVLGKGKPGAAASATTSEMYFPDWIYKDLERQGIDVSPQEHMSEEDRELARKMIIVGLWCIQTSPADRPPICKVIEMLEGSLDCIQVPPKPLCSPTRSTLASSSSITLNYE